MTLTNPGHPWRQVPILGVDGGGVPALATALGGEIAFRERVLGQARCGGAGDAETPIEIGTTDRPEAPLRESVPLALHWDGPNRFVVEGAGLEQGGVVVVAESAGIWPGWTAEAVTRDGDRIEVPVLPAQVVATGIPVPRGTVMVAASYGPPGFVAGSVVAGATLLVAAGGWLRLRSREGAAGAGGSESTGGSVA